VEEICRYRIHGKARTQRDLSCSPQNRCPKRFFPVVFWRLARCTSDTYRNPECTRRLMLSPPPGGMRLWSRGSGSMANNARDCGKRD
jgi:hypothetical protein